MKLTIDLNDLIIDTGYGERDCTVQAEVLIHTKPTVIYNTPLGAYMGEEIASMEILEKAIFLVDQDGGESEYCSDCEEFDQLILDEAREQYANRN